MKKQFLLAGLGLTFLIASCNKDEETSVSQLSKTDAKAEIATFNSTATQDLQDLANAEGLEALADLNSLTNASDPFGGRANTNQKNIKTYLRQKAKAFRSIFNHQAKSGRSNAYEPFDYNANKGVYAWSFATESFDKIGSSTIVEIQFPTEGSTTNDAKLLLKKYAEEQFFDDFLEEYTYEPTLIEASLLVNNTEVAYLDANADYDSNGFPITADIAARVNPFSATLSFDVSGSTRNTLSASLSKSQETLAGISIAVNYKNSSKTEENLKSIDGYVQMKNMKLQGSLDFEASDASADGDPNRYIKLVMLANEKKVGDIVFVSEMVSGVEEYVPYLQYADGSKEKLETVLKPVKDELDDLSEELDRNG